MTMPEWLSGPGLQALIQVAAAMGLGGVIGLEREIHERPAGFRTHMLVAGAAAFLVVSTQLAVADLSATAGSTSPVSILRMDPLRMVEAVVAGVAFIGAGCIFASREKDAVHGVTTAASLLMVAAIGLCTGLGHGALAAAVTLMTLVVLCVLKQIEKWMKRRAAS
jgi:putative Mg2+ transporter-C (MgtC) family protein